MWITYGHVATQWDTARTLAQLKCELTVTQRYARAIYYDC